MNIHNTIDVTTGISLFFIGNGGINYLHNESMSQYSIFNTKIGLMSTVFTGILYFYYSYD